MFESFSSNIIFIAIALAIFIGRTVAEAKKKKKAPPPAAPRVPALHFEEDDEEPTQRSIGRKIAAPVTKAAGKKVSAKKQVPVSPAKPVNFPLSAKMDTSSPPVTGGKTSPAKRNTQTVSPGQTGFAFNLNHLSPLKQAVVMAEILGPPKGMI